MRIIFRSFVAVSAFLVGIGMVSIAEYAIDWIVVDEVSVNSIQFEEPQHLSTLFTPIDFQVNGLRVGATRQEVTTLLGKPVRIEGRDTRHPELFVYRYKGLEVRIGEYLGSKTVDSIEIVSDEQSFEGLTVGSSLNEVRAKLGPEHFAHEGMLGYYGVAMDGYIAFKHDGTKVIAILSGFDGC